MRIHLASSGITLPNYVNVGSQTPANAEEMQERDEADQHSSMSSLQSQREGSRAGSHLAEIVITEASPFVGDSMDEGEESQPGSRRKQKRERQLGIELSRHHIERNSSHPDVNDNDESTQEQNSDTKEDYEDDIMQSRISSKRSVKMENKVFSMCIS